MALHDLTPKIKNKTSKRIGRGGKRGTYSGRGMKGQKSRAGNRTRPAVRDLIKSIHKLRGYDNHPLKENVVISLEVLDKNFNNNEIVNVANLRKKGMLGNKYKANAVKILNNGEISKSLTIEHILISEKAKQKIEKAGGQIIK